MVQEKAKASLRPWSKAGQWRSMCSVEASERHQGQERGVPLDFEIELVTIRRMRTWENLSPGHESNQAWIVFLQRPRATQFAEDSDCSLEWRRRARFSSLAASKRSQMFITEECSKRLWAGGGKEVKWIWESTSDQTLFTKLPAI